MDACVTLEKEICNLISNGLETINENYNNQLKKERVTETLNKNEYGSLFGHSKTETTSSSESSEEWINHSDSHHSRVDAKAELATKMEQSNAIEEIQAQKK